MSFKKKMTMSKKTKTYIVLCIIALLVALLSLFCKGRSDIINQQIADQKRAEASVYAAKLLGETVPEIDVLQYEESFLDKIILLFGGLYKYFFIILFDLIIVTVYLLLNNRENKKNTMFSFLKNRTQSNVGGILLALCVLFINLSLLSDVFLTTSNLINVVQQININFIVAVGMTFVIISGGIDLSVGSNMGLSALFMAVMMNYWNFPVYLSIILGILLSIIIGFVNGLIITKFDIPPFIATLGTMYVGRGLAYSITGGRTISEFPQAFKAITSRIFGFPVYSTLIMIVVFLIGLFVLNKTRLGRYTYSIGGNETCSKLSGINVKKYKTLIYIVSGLCCGIAAVILGSRLNSATVTNADGYEMDAIAAVVIGGSSMSGGEGSLFGTLIGIFIIGFISNGLNLLGVGQGPQKIVKGIIIVIAVIIDVVRRKNMENKKGE